MLSDRQKYLLDAMEKLRCIRTDQLSQLSQRRFGTLPQQFGRDIRQLCYLNKLMISGDAVLLPGRTRHDDLIAAVDMMLQLSGDSVLDFAIGVPPCSLFFFLEAAGGRVNVFKVIPVARGRERPVLSQLDRICGSYTILFHIENRAQIDLLHTKPPYHFVVFEENRYVFLKGCEPEGRG